MKQVMMMATMKGNQAPAVNFLSVAEISIEIRGRLTGPKDTVDETEEHEEADRDDEYEAPDYVHDGRKESRGDNHDACNCFVSIVKFG